MGLSADAAYILADVYRAVVAATVATVALCKWSASSKGQAVNQPAHALPAKCMPEDLNNLPKANSATNGIKLLPVRRDSCMQL